MKSCTQCGNDLPAGARKYCSEKCRRDATLETYYDKFHADERARWNAELNMRRVILIYDPLPVEEGGYSYGARFLATEVLAYGANFNRKEYANMTMPARDCWMPGTKFAVRPFSGPERVFEVDECHKLIQVDGEAVA